MPQFRLFLTLVLSLAAGLASARHTSETITFHSRALDRQTTYIALIPDGARADQRFPVLYLLHGAWGSYRDWTSNTSITEQLDYEMIVVTPDGAEFGWYVDSPRTAGSNYESFITRDLIEDVDGRLPTRAERNARAIAGLSMGGHGALSLAAKHPHLFGSASSLSGILNLQAHPKNWELPDRLGELPGANAEWAKHSVVDLADRFTTAGVALLFDTGTSDSAAALPDNRALHQKLTQLNVKHTYREYPGNHNWQYWSLHLPEHLMFHAEAFGLRQRND